ncbi:MAG: polysaccharide deacetylase family protein [Parafilimonas sp.]|nr:polysaccharide deacetylase family protein [Parafilimonas sp.]
MKRVFAICMIAVVFSQCTQSHQNVSNLNKGNKNTAAIIAKATVNGLAILQKKQVPVLCYHHIENWKPKEKASLKLLLSPIKNFDDQIKSLADSGYQTITPDEYYAYLTTGAPLPPKPVMITFDDTNKDQYTYGLPELNKYHFKAVFFITTVPIDKRKYMSAEQLKEIADEGHVIAAHTFDHPDIARLKTAQDYENELLKPKQQLEAITGKPVDCFAYPYGIIDPKVYPLLERDGYKSAYQLVQFKRDTTYPLYTLRRIIVPGTWNGVTMQKWMKIAF